MKKITSLRWPLILGLGTLALVRPLWRIVGDRLDIMSSPVVPIVLTIVISVVWIMVVGFSSTEHPVLTLLFTALTYAVLSTILSGILSPILDGELQGPLAQPIAIIPVLAINAAWGLAAGALALVIQRLRARRAERT